MAWRIVWPGAARWAKWVMGWVKRRAWIKPSARPIQQQPVTKPVTVRRPGR